MERQAKHMLQGVAISLASLLFFATQSQAQSTVYLSEGASQCEIFRGLSRQLPKECQPRGLTRGFVVKPRHEGPRMRGIVFRPEPVEPAAAQGQQAMEAAPAPQQQPAPAQVQVASVEPVAVPAPAAPLSVSFRAEFEFNSADLTPEARLIIDRVAAVLNHELMRDKVIQIEGHADSVGSDEYNLVLSEKRAKAVRDYLVRAHGADPARLRYVGKGEREPFDPSDPASAVNRRVEFKNVTG